MKIRDASISDLPDIVAIYNAAIGDRMATADTDPVSTDSRERWYRSHDPKERPLWIAEAEEKMVGWLSFELFYGRPAYQATAEISIYVAPYYHSRGIGQHLLERAIARGPDLGLKTLVAYIFAHNTPSLRLFEKCGFREWGYLPRVAELDGIERDLIIMGRRLRERSR
ncbi:MAG: N-acetyltransferase family protein [Cyanobacteria bacterium J055]|nr:MAG: N-acetyltransferase family protein [Cyanobacteria bacterium J055]